MQVGDWIYVRWTDSYGVQSGWTDIGEYRADMLVIESAGRVIYEDDNVISLAHNYANTTENTPQQANGIMVIPKCAIIKVLEYETVCK